MYGVETVLITSCWCTIKFENDERYVQATGGNFNGEEYEENENLQW